MTILLADGSRFDPAAVPAPEAPNKPTADDKRAMELQYQFDQGYDLALAQVVAWLRVHEGIGSGVEAADYVTSMREGKKKRKGKRGNAK